MDVTMGYIQLSEILSVRNLVVTILHIGSNDTLHRQMIGCNERLHNKTNIYNTNNKTNY